MGIFCAALGIIIGFVVLMFYSEKQMDEYKAKCEAAGGVSYRVEGMGKKCFKPEIFIEIK